MMKLLFISSLFFSGIILAQQNAPPILYESNIGVFEDQDRSAIDYGFNKAVVSLIPIQINKDAFSYVQSADKYIKIDNQLATGQTFEFLIPNLNKVVNLTVTTVEQLLPESSLITYSGHTLNDENTTFKFTVGEDGVFGRVRYENFIYFIEPNAKLDGKQTLAVIDRSLIPYDSDDTPEMEPKNKNKELEELYNKSGGNGNVRILVYYANNVSNGYSKAITLVSDFNQALSNSQVNSNNQLSFAGIQQLNSNLDGLSKADIVGTYMPQNLGAFVNIDQDMAATGADIVFTIVNGPAGPDDPKFPNYNGIIGGQVSLIFNMYVPFAVSADNYLASSADYTGIHEIGHLLNGRHPTDGDNPNRGIINTSDSNYYWQSLMGFYDYSPCTFGSPKICNRIQYFSSPNLSHNSEPLGDIDHDMVSNLNLTMPIASNWRGSPIPKPTTPNNLTVTSAQCHGHNFVGWDPVSGADSYHLYRVSGSNLIPLYSGTSSSWIFINVTSGTWPLKVKACNAAGCSALSSAEYANYVNYCM